MKTIISIFKRYLDFKNVSYTQDPSLPIFIFLDLGKNLNSEYKKHS